METTKRLKISHAVVLLAWAGKKRKGRKEGKKEESEKEKQLPEVRSTVPPFTISDV